MGSPTALFCSYSGTTALGAFALDEARTIVQVQLTASNGWQFGQPSTGVDSLLNEPRIFATQCAQYATVDGRATTVTGSVVSNLAPSVPASRFVRTSCPLTLGTVGGGGTTLSSYGLGTSTFTSPSGIDGSFNSSSPSFVLRGGDLFYLPWAASIRSQLESGIVVETVRLNSDERDDVVVIGSNSVYVVVQGQSAFDMARFLAISTSPFTFGYTSDVDGDGDSDIVLEAADGLYWLQNMCDEVLSGATQSKDSTTSGTTLSTTSRPPVTVPEATRITLSGDKMDLSEAEPLAESALIAIGIGAACLVLLVLLATLRFRRARRQARQGAGVPTGHSSSHSTSRPTSRRATRGTSSKKIHAPAPTPTPSASARSSAPAKGSSSATVPTAPSSSSGRAQTSSSRSTDSTTHTYVSSYTTAVKPVNSYSPSKPIAMGAYHQTSLYPAPGGATYPSPS